MEETNLIVEGFKFMGLGMGTVFLFLIIMIFAMSAMSKILNKFFPEVKPNLDAGRASKKDNKKVVAAVTAAIKHHRQG